MATSLSLPPTLHTMRRWQYTSLAHPGGLPPNMVLTTTAPLPIPKPTQHLLCILACGLNPVDYKPAETPLIGPLLTTGILPFKAPVPATPGVDICAQVVIPAVGSGLKEGDLVFGASGTNPVAGGGLAEYGVAPAKHVVPLPEGVDPIDAGAVLVAGLTAYQSIVPHVSKLSPGERRLFINGGSGGVGTFGIQIAKQLGCYVVVSCSGKNAEFCRQLGADRVVDYTALGKGDLVDALVEVCEAEFGAGKRFTHVVDNVGKTTCVWWRAQDYMAPDAKLVIIAGEQTMQNVWEMAKRKFFPGWAGGLKRKALGFWPAARAEDLMQIGEWMKEGKVKPVIEKVYTFEEGAEAFERLKSGRVRGKLVVDVAGLSNGQERR